MNSTSVVGVLILLSVLVFVFGIFLSRKKKNSQLEAFLKANAFKKTPSSLSLPFGYSDMSSVVSFTGVLKSSVNIEILLGKRRGATQILNQAPVVFIEEHLGIYVPAPSGHKALREDWLATLKADPFAQGSRPTQVTLHDDGGLLITWRCPHSVENLKARFEEIAKVLLSVTFPEPFQSLKLFGGGMRFLREEPCYLPGIPPAQGVCS